jgi:hypothetical protein
MSGQSHLHLVLLRMRSTTRRWSPVMAVQPTFSTFLSDVDDLTVAIRRGRGTEPQKSLTEVRLTRWIGEGVPEEVGQGLVLQVLSLKQSRQYEISSSPRSAQPRARALQLVLISQKPFCCSVWEGCTCCKHEILYVSRVPIDFWTSSTKILPCHGEHSLDRLHFVLLGIRSVT